MRESSIQRIRAYVDENLHYAPLFLSLQQLPFYLWYFLNFDSYSRYMQLVDMIFRDNIYVMAAILLFNTKWYFANVMSMSCLITLWVLNLYGIIFGMSLDNYYAFIMVVAYVFHLPTYVRFVSDISNRTNIVH